jgi:hypothetical protein
VNKTNLPVNPVARAIYLGKALTTLRSQCLTNLIYFRMLEDGEYCEEKLTQCMQVVSMAMHVAEARGQSETPDFNVMRGSQMAMINVAQNGFKWNRRHAVSVDEGTRRGVSICKAAKGSELTRAWEALMQGEANAALSATPSE